MKIKLTVILVSFIVFSCEIENNKTDRPAEGIEKPAENKPAEAIRLEMDQLTDSLNKAWNEMTVSDNQKLDDIKRLLDEISYTDKYNVTLYDSLIVLNKQLKAVRYDSINMTSAGIDAYDQATEKILESTMRLLKSSPEIESHPLAATLLKDILEADNDMIRQRMEYDQWVKQYNATLEMHSRQLEKLGAPYNAYTKKAMFTIQ